MTRQPWLLAAALVAALVHGVASSGSALAQGRAARADRDLAPDAVGTDGRPSVLVLIPVQPGRPVFDLLARGVMSAFLRAPGPPANVFVEYLYDLAEPPDLADRQAEFIKAKYRARDIAAIVAFQHPRYLRIRETLDISPAIPLIFATLDPVARPPGTAVVEVRGDEADSYAFVSRYLPSPEVVALVGGNSPGDRLLNAGLTRKLEALAPRRVVDLTTVPLAELPTRVAALPERSVIVVGTCLGDSTGQPITCAMLMKAVAPAARGPIVVANEILLGSGALGGRLYSFEEVGTEAATLALDVLRGTPVDAVPTRTVTMRPVFDARQLRRFGIDEAALPAGTQFLFREPTRWQANRSWILFGVSALAIQSALILGLFVERRRRRASEVELDARATRHALVTDVSSDFAHLPHDDIDGHVAVSLAHVGTVLEVAECALWTIDSQKGPSLLSRWRSEPGQRLPSMLDEALLAWACPRLLRDEVVNLPDVSEVRESALFHAGPHHAAALLLPLRVDGQVMGCLSVLHSHSGDWPIEVADGLRTVGEIIATAVARKRTDASMRHQLASLAHVNRVAGLGELAASLAHQLNQPLAAMMSNAEVAALLLERPDPPVAEIREILGDLIADNERAGGIIRHMRTMLKKQHVKPTLVDVNAIVTRLTALVAHDARLRGSSLDVELGQDLPPVLMDSTQLKQVLLNLVVNATDAMASARSRQPVELRTISRDDGVLIEIRDHGQGISADALWRLFDPFFTTKPDGLGVGLSITRSIVEAAGGRISAQNVPAGGAVFRVWLPDASATTD